MTSAGASGIRRIIVLLGLVALLGAAFAAPAAAMADRNASASFLADAKDYAARGKIDDAIAQLKNALKADPNNIEARIQLADLYIQQNNGTSAEKEIKAAIERGKLHHELDAKLAQTYLLQGKYEDVLNELSPDGVPDEVRPGLLCARAEAYFSLGKPKAAISTYQAAETLIPDDARPKIGLARAYIRVGDLQSANVNADAALRIDPNSADAIVAKGQVLQAQGDRENAVAKFDEALKIKPNDIVGLISRAVALVDLKQYDKAMPDILAARKTDPLLPSAAYLNALVEARKGNFQKAGDVLQQADPILRDYTPAIYLSGAVAYARGAYEQAIIDFNSYMAIEPNNISVARMLSAALLRTGDADSAISVLTPILPNAAQDERIRAILGSAYMAKKQYRAAVAQFERAVEIAPDDGSLRTKLLVARMAVGDDEGALKALPGTLAADPEAVSAAGVLAANELRNKNFDAVLEIGRALHAKQPTNPVGEGIIAAALWAMGDFKGAREHYNRALQVDAKYEPAKLALARLDAQEKKTDSARKRYRLLLRDNSKDVQALMGLYWVAYSEGDSGAQDRWLTRAIETNPSAAAPKLELIRRHAVAGELDRALLEANELVRNHPEDAKALQILAEIQLKVGDPIAAITTASELVNVAPSLPRGYVLKSRAEVAVQNLDDARATLSRGLNISPKDPTLNGELVRLELRQRKYDRALDAAQAFREQVPGAEGDQLVGDVELATGQFDAAIASFKSAYAKRPSADLAARLNTAYKQKGDPAAGMAAVKAWLADNPKDYAMRAVLASAELDQGQTAAAQKLFEALYAEKPTDPIVLNNLAWIYHQKKDARALEMARKAYAADKNSAQILDTLGWISLTSESAQSGLDYLRMAVAMAPRASDIRYHLAVALTRTGHGEEAKTVLTSLLADDGDFAESGDAKQLLTKLGG